MLTPDALDAWAARVRAWCSAGLDAFVYFDNDAEVRAPFDALALAARLDPGPPGTGWPGSTRRSAEPGARPRGTLGA